MNVSKAVKALSAATTVIDDDDDIASELNDLYDEQSSEYYYSELLQQYFAVKRIPTWNKSEIELDRIDHVSKDVVCRVIMERLLSMAPNFAAKVLKYLASNGAAKGNYRVPEMSTQQEYDECVLRRGAPRNGVLDPWRTKVVKCLLRESNLFTFLEPEIVATMRNETNLKNAETASIFLVEKPGTATLPDGSDCMMRVITDARRANARCKDSATFEMPTLDAILQMVSNISHGADDRGEYYAISADLRHWFFQLELPDRLKPLFTCIATDGGRYVPTALPMGWKLAPIIAQNATWSLLLGKDRGNFPVNMGIEDEAKLRGSETAPAWVPLWEDAEESSSSTRLVGAIFVVIDNIFIVCSDYELICKWQERLRRTTDYVNAKLKGDDNPLKIATLRRESSTAENLPSESVEFMGINFEYRRWNTVEKRERIIDPRATDLTKRKLCSLLGEAHWDLRVRRIAALELGPFLELHQLAMPNISAGETWDSPVTLKDGSQRDVLINIIEDARKHLFCERQSPWNPKGGIIKRFAVDASLEVPSDSSRGLRQLGIVDMDSEGSPSICKWYSADHEDDYIGVAELRAAVKAVKDAMVGGDDQVCLVLMAGDSLCAKGWIERGYSKRLEARELLSELRSHLGSSTRLMYVYVPSEDNVADGPSRWSKEECSRLRRWKGWIIGATQKMLTKDTFADRYEATKKILDEIQVLGCAVALKQGRQFVKSKVIRRRVPTTSADRNNEDGIQKPLAPTVET